VAAVPAQAAPAAAAGAFAAADCTFALERLTFQGTTVLDDPSSVCNEQELLARMPDGTLRYRTNNSIDPPGTNGKNVFLGTAQADKVRGGNNQDTVLGGAGNDTIEGSDGTDNLLGGEGKDIITDSAGNDVMEGGTGNDALAAGPGLDLLHGGEGADFTSGGPDSNETHGGSGNDLIIAGSGDDEAFGDDGDDWIEGGDGADFLVGDSGPSFPSDPNSGGNDVIGGQGGDDQVDAGAGDDVVLAGPGIDRIAGGAGYDWSIHQRDPSPASADLKAVPSGTLLPGDVPDTYTETEALSGAGGNDVLKGDDSLTAGPQNEGSGRDRLFAEDVARVQRLVELLPQDPTATGNTWGGNILLGGGGSDILEGRGGDDILDGDKYLRVRLSIRSDAADPGTEIGSTDGLDKPYLAGSSTTLQEAVSAGTVDPGNIIPVREIVDGARDVDEDTAVFSDVRANYTVTTEPAGALMGAPGSFTIVEHVGSGADGGDGTDILRNVERLVFADS
jgi:Ca2+-binding RTX toxin-like protein